MANEDGTVSIEAENGGVEGNEVDSITDVSGIGQIEEQELHSKTEGRFRRIERDIEAIQKGHLSMVPGVSEHTKIKEISEHQEKIDSFANNVNTSVAKLNRDILEIKAVLKALTLHSHSPGGDLVVPLNVGGK
jgi:hypothetical protein